MDLFNKIKLYVDYNNSYSVNKMLTTLHKEFETSIIKKKYNHAKDIISVTTRLYEDFTKMYRESEDYGETMSYSQRRTANKMRDFIAYLYNQIKHHTRADKKYQEQISAIIKNQKG